jgi:predicted AlkP superfamily pyrophosphatase or phosphodiesterase
MMGENRERQFTQGVYIMTTWILRACATAVLTACGVLGQSFAPAAETTDPFGGKHALVIGLDGCRSDALRAANVPHLKSLIEQGTVCYSAYAGGKLGTKTQQPTVSGPGWGSILTGVWLDKHHLPDNEFANPNLKRVVAGKIVGYPHFFTRIKEKSPNCCLASIVNWAPINDKILSDADCQAVGRDAEVARKCVDLLLGDRDPAVVFLQFDELDGVGHSKTYGPQSPDYMKMLETLDGHIGTVLAAMRKRAHFAQEDWLVLVTSDHGGINKGHGGQTPEERTVFLIANGGGYPRQVVSGDWGIVAIPSTVLHHLGIPIDPAWGWESAPFGVE